MYLRMNDMKSDWRLWYKILALIAVLTFVIVDYVFKLDAVSRENNTSWAIFEEGTGELLAYDYIGFNIFYITSFNFILTFMIFMWLLMSIIKHNIIFSRWQRSFWLSRTITIMTTAFGFYNIVFYLSFIVPGNVLLDVYKTEAISFLLCEVTLNVLAPTIFIIYICCFNVISYERTYDEDFYKTTVPLSAIVPTLYLATEFVRSLVLYYMYDYNVELAGTHHAFRFYFFDYLNSNVFGMHGAIWFVIVILLTGGLIFGFSYAVHRIIFKQTKY